MFAKLRVDVKSFYRPHVRVEAGPCTSVVLWDAYRIWRLGEEVEDVAAEKVWGHNELQVWVRGGKVMVWQ